MSGLHSLPHFAPVSTTTALGIILTTMLVISVVIVGVMFWWGAREDGRDQRRIDALTRETRESPGDDDVGAGA